MTFLSHEVGGLGTRREHLVVRRRRVTVEIEPREVDRSRVGHADRVEALVEEGPGCQAWLGWSPPVVLDGAVGATGLVEGVERGHVLGGEREVEDASVLDDPLAVGGLRQDDQVALQAPA